MKLVEVKKEDLLNKNKTDERIELIENFIKSDMEAAEITEHHYCNNSSCASSFRDLIYRKGYTEVKVRLVNGKPYLIKGV